MWLLRQKRFVVFALGLAVGGALGIGYRGLGNSEAHVPVPLAQSPVSVQQLASIATPPGNSGLVSIADAVSSVVRIQSGVGSGSGVVIDPTGLVVTSAHLVEGTRWVDVVIGEAIYEGTVVGVDAELDLALIRLPEGSYPAAELGRAADIVLGGDVVAIGYPLELTGPPTATSGIVSRILYDAERHRQLVQTDASINRGNSGGALVNANGKVIGVITGFLGDGPPGIARGIAFAVSAETLREDFLPKLPDGWALARPPVLRRGRWRPS